MLAEDSFILVTNPVENYYPAQLGFFGMLTAFQYVLHENYLDSTMKSVNFEFGEKTEAYFACTTVLNGETLILGGQKQSNQVCFISFAENISKYIF